MTSPGSPIQVDAALVARCGLYCGACRSFRKGKCPGCAGNHAATWCQVRTCCAERGYASCAACTDHPDPRACRRFHGVVSTVIGVVLNSDRRACVLKVRELGLDGYAAFMAERGRQTLPRRGRVG